MLFNNSKGILPLVRSRVLSRLFHASTVHDDKKAVIFDMGGVILPSPFSVAYSE